MAFSEIYVDPSIAADSGAGTVGDPYGDLEYAIEQTTFDTTNGTRVNIKAGTDEILAAVLETAMNDTGTSVAWAPAEDAPCIFEGYTAAAGDGGIGGISGGGSIGIMGGAAFDFVNFVNLHLHNCGGANIINIDNSCRVINCEVNGGAGGILLDATGVVIGCHVHDVATTAIQVVTGVVLYNRVESTTTNEPATGIDCPGNGVIQNNIVDVTGTGDGIKSRAGSNIDHNSVYSAAGTGQGIVLTASDALSTISNNIVEGFSDTGGIGYDLDAADCIVGYYVGNAAYDNATEYAAPGGYSVWAEDNETLTSSAFTDPANGDFSPVDTGNVAYSSYYW